MNQEKHGGNKTDLRKVTLISLDCLRCSLKCDDIGTNNDVKHIPLKVNPFLITKMYELEAHIGIARQ